MAVEVYRFPKLFQTVMRMETLLMVECQGHFREEQEGRELEVNEYHIFGPSVFNVHIES